MTRLNRPPTLAPPDAPALDPLTPSELQREPSLPAPGDPRGVAFDAARRGPPGSSRIGALSGPFRDGRGEAEPLEEHLVEVAQGRPLARAPSRTPSVWDLAWPAMTTYALHSMVGVVDFLFVSRLGTESVAAVGVAVQIHFFVFGALSAITTGTVAVVAREWGRGDRDEAARATRVAIGLSALLGLALMGMMPFTEALVSLLGVRDEVAAVAGRCLAVLLGFNVPFAIGIALTMALRGAGDVRTPLLIGLFTNVLNVIGDYALIFGRFGAPELGAVGSAWASGITFLIGSAILWRLWSRDSLVLAYVPHRLAHTRERARRQLRIGLPTAAEQAAFQIGLLIFLGVVAGYGTEPVSAYLIGVRILSLCFVPGLGFSTAASTLVGQHLGAREETLAARSGWRASFGAIGVMGALGLAIVVAAPQLAQLFGAAGERTVELTIVFIYILGAAQPLMAIEFALGGALRGAGDTGFPLLTILTGLFVFRLGAALFVVVPLFDNVVAVWCCLLADYCVKALMLVARFRSGRWLRVDV